MLQHFTRVIFRFLSRKLFFTGLNIAGLSVGLACCIVIYLFISDEMSYDNFHRDGDKIFRAIRQSQMNGMPYNIGVTAAPFGPALQQEFPERIRSVTRALSFNGLVTFEDRSFIEDKLFLADSNFFSFFSFPLLKGDRSSVLKNGNSLVLSETLAQKYFGEEDPIGKVVRIDDQYDMMVTGVMAQLPGNSHLEFDAVGSMNIAAGEDWFNDWWANSFYTYITIGRSGDEVWLNKAFPAFMDKYFGKDFARIGNRIELKLEPLRDIYFNYDTRYEQNVAHGDRRYVFIFGTIGILLVVLAAINYINLATAQASSRAKEVGIRKTLGSAQRTVAFQFLSESFVLCLISAVVGIGIAQLAIPFLNEQFALSIPDVFAHQRILIFVFFLLMIITLLAGAYPSFLLSSFKPIDVLKGEVKGNLRYVLVRKALVVFQFGISGFMIISTLFIGEQLRYMRDKDLGFQPDQLIVVNLNNGLINRERFSFIETLLSDRHFSNASLASGYPGGFYDATTVLIEGQEENMRMRTLYTDEAYLRTLNLSMAAGRFFSQDFPGDSANAVVLNETAVRQLGWEPDQAIGKKVRLAQFEDRYKEVVGVITDYHFTSLKQKIEPLVISHLNDRGNLIVRMDGGAIREAMIRFEDIWDSYNTGFPADVVFLDDVIDRLYRSEKVQGKIFTLFSIVSVCIACLGILGLGSYIASQRTKEIGIRKVLGATTTQVSALLVKDLLWLVLIANILAIPVGYYAMYKWLEGFAYHTGIQPIVFLLGSGAVFLIAALIAGVNASRVARKNPVTSLRTE